MANVSCLRKVLTPSLLNVTYADKNPGVTFDARLTGLLYAKAALGVWVPVYVFFSHSVPCSALEFINVLCCVCYYELSIVK